MNDCDDIDSLIFKTAEDDMESFEKLYLCTEKAIYGFLLSILKNFDVAKDIMQETYIKIKLFSTNYKSDGKPMAWIFTIARNQAYSYLKKSNKEVASKDFIGQSDVEFSSQVEDKLFLQEIFKILNRDQLQIVFLHVVAGFKHREIADFLNIPLGTVLCRYNSAIKKIQKEIMQFFQERYTKHG